MTAEAGATVWYKAGTAGSWLSTTSGSTPSIDGIDSGGSGTIQAYAFSASKFQSGTNVSDSANPYKLRLANPTSTAAYATNSYASGTLAFSAQSGAVIRYTTDGTVPTAATPTVYSALLTYSVPTKVYAKAFKTGYIPSGHISSWVNKLPAPKIAGSAGVIAADTTVENALDVWLLPNFGYPNMYARGTKHQRMERDSELLGGCSQYRLSRLIPGRSGELHNPGPAAPRPSTSATDAPTARPDGSATSTPRR